MIGELLILWVMSPDAYYGSATMYVELVDGCGTTVSDERSVILVPQQTGQTTALPSEAKVEQQSNLVERLIEDRRGDRR